MTPRDRAPGGEPSPAWIVLGRMPFEGVRHVWHHMAIRLSERGPAVYVRDPVRASPRRAWHRSLVDAVGVREVLPVDFPFQRIRALRRACERTAARAILASLRAGDRPRVAVLYPRSPLALALACEPDLVVFHATDEFARDWSGRPDESYLRWERAALARTDLVVAVVSSLADRIRAAGHGRVAFLPNGFDERTFDGAPRPVPPDLAALPRPILGYAGSVYPDKIDTALLEEAAAKRPGWTFALVGPVFDEGSATLARLRRIPGVRLLGPRAFEEVPAFVGAFDVAINPHRADPAGKEFLFYPLKAYDALAMGRPVVLTPRSPLDSLAPHAVFAGDATGFVAAVEAALAANGDPGAPAARRAAVAEHSWGRRVDAIEALVRKTLRERGPRGAPPPRGPAAPA